MTSDVLSRIKSFPVSEVLGHYISLKSKGSDYIALCPFHNDSNPSLHVSDKKGVFKCFPCDAGGDAIAFVQKYKNLSFREALLEIADKLNIPVDDLKSSKKRDPKYDLAFRVNKCALKIFRECAQSQKYPEYGKFIQHRKLTPEIATQFALGYAPGDNVLTRYFLGLPETDRKKAVDMAQKIGLIQPSTKRLGEFYDTFRDRIIFPIWNQYDEVVGFGSRAVFDYQKGKYINSRESFLFNKKYTLYGLNFAKQSIREHSQVILVEGYMDCLALAMSGLTNVVAVMGVAMGAKMAKTLSHMASDIVLGFDSDDAGLAAATRVNELFLPEGLLPRHLDYSPHKDPDEFLQGESRIKLREKIERAPAFLDFLIRRELGPSIPKNIDGKLAKLHRVFDLVAPLKKSLLATERIIESAKKLGLKSTHEQILESYQGHLSKQRKPYSGEGPREGHRDSERVLPLGEGGDGPSVSDSPEGELSKADCVILENFAQYPECFKDKDYGQLLEYVSHDEVKQLIQLLEGVYLEVNEGHYPKVALAALERERVGQSAMSIIAGGLLRYVPRGMGEEKVKKLLQDLRRKLKRGDLIERRGELERLRRESTTDGEGYEYLRKINTIQQEINQLTRTSC